MRDSDSRAGGITGEQRAVLSVVIITSFMTSFAGSAVNLAIPSISLEFSGSAILTGWVVTGYLLINSSMAVPFGRIADLTGRRWVLIGGIFIFTACSALCVFAPSMYALIGMRVLQGVGAAMIFSTNIAILVGAFPLQRRGRVLGYSVAAVYVGLSAGPVVGGVLNYYLGWKSIFLSNAAMGFLVFLMALRFLPKDARPDMQPVDGPGHGSARPDVAISQGGGRPGGGAGQTSVRPDGKTNHAGAHRPNDFDIPGILLYITMILAVMYGFSALAGSTPAKFIIAGGFLLGALFFFHERRADSPVVKVSLFADNPDYALSNLAALLNYGATFALGYLLSIYLQVAKGFDSQTAGLILISQPIMMAVLSPFAGRLSDRVSPFKLASLGMGFCALGLLSFAFISDSYPMWLIIANLIVEGVGFALFSSPNSNAIMSCVAPRDHGVASSLLATMRTIGHTSSMAVVTLITAAHMGTATFAGATPQQLIGAMRTGFIIFTVICAVGVLFSLQRKGTRPHADA
ncbi:MAG: MFS transporter [Clostridiales Family XIII bacterium]|jgi:MFS family permease|nr:MFS transporter [Clostridiales Family XIII bacterium]